MCMGKTIYRVKKALVSMTGFGIMQGFGNDL